MITSLLGFRNYIKLMLGNPVVNVDCTIDNVITTRAYINIAGPTIYYNKIKIKI